MEFVGKKINYYFDAQRQGFTTNDWKTLSGTPSVDSSNAVVFSAGSAIGVADVSRGELTLFLTVPAAPTSGDVREWGLKQINTGASATFKVTDAVLTAYAADGKGNTVSSTITWNSLWTATEVRFKISYAPGTISFFVNDVEQAVLRDVACPNAPLSVYVKNSDADSVKLTTYQLRDANVTFPAVVTAGSGSGSGSGSSSSSPFTAYQNDSFTTAVAKTSSGHVYSLSVINTTNAVRYLQIHNSAAVPSSGDTPEYKVMVPPGGNVGVGTEVFGTIGLLLSTGIAVANSTTATTYTAGSAGDLLLDLYYDGATTTTQLLLENNDNMLLETGDLVLQE